MYVQDSWLNKNFVSSIAAGVEAIAIFDCCHSGSMFDLRYQFSYWWYQLMPSTNETDKIAETKGRLTYLSACSDVEHAKELTWKDGDGNIAKRGGALTLSFIKLVDNNPELTLED